MQRKFGVKLPYKFLAIHSFGKTAIVRIKIIVCDIMVNSDYEGNYLLLTVFELLVIKNIKV